MEEQKINEEVKKTPVVNETTPDTPPKTPEEQKDSSESNQTETKNFAKKIKIKKPKIDKEKDELIKGKSLTYYCRNAKHETPL